MTKANNKTAKIELKLTKNEKSFFEIFVKLQ